MNAFKLSIIGQILLNAALLLMLWKSTKKGSIWRKVGLVGVIIELCIFLGFYIARWHLTLDTLANVLRIFNGYYVAIAIFIFWLLVAFAIIGIAKRLKWIPTHEQRVRARGISFVALIPITGVLCVWGYHNTMNPITTHYNVEVHGAQQEELRLALITDIHVGEIIGVTQMSRLTEMVQATNPDFVLIGGDMIDFMTEFAYRPGIGEALDELHPDKNHIIYVLGNHEYYHALEEKEAWIRERGVLLKDSVMPLTENIWLIGRDDATNKERLPLSSLVAQVPENAATLLLDHQPSEPEEVRENNIDLAMHGHTHQGQFIPFKWVVEMNFERAYGHYVKGNNPTQYVISSGFGVSTAPFRIGTRSEIVVIDLKVTQP